MVFRLLADLVVVLHLAFILFVAAGGLLVLRWPWLVRLHLPPSFGATPSSPSDSPVRSPRLSTHLRGRAGEQGYDGGFVDRYIEGVIYPGALTPLVRALISHGGSRWVRRHDQQTPSWPSRRCRRRPDLTDALSDRVRARHGPHGRDRTCGHGTPERRPPELKQSGPRCRRGASGVNRSGGPRPPGPPLRPRPSSRCRRSAAGGGSPTATLSMLGRACRHRRSGRAAVTMAPADAAFAPSTSGSDSKASRLPTSGTP